MGSECQLHQPHEDGLCEKRKLPSVRCREDQPKVSGPRWRLARSERGLPEPQKQGLSEARQLSEVWIRQPKWRSGTLKEPKARVLISLQHKYWCMGMDVQW